MANLEDSLVTGGGMAIANQLEPAHRALIGREIGRYRVVDVIAEGGMGVVCRAEHIDGDISRTVALKLSLQSFLGGEHDHRFQVEKSILSQLRHPNISHFYDAGISTDGLPYFVMELVEGQHSDEWARSQSVARVVEMVIDVCEAVAFAHSRLVIHRDIKPPNVLVDEQNRVKLVDFGIGKFLGDVPDQEATAQALSPGYASPEQLRADSLTTATDIYQLGGLLRHLLFEVPEVDLKTAIDRAVRGEDVRLAAAERTLLGRELCAIIERCLRNDPRHRYPSVFALIAELRAWQGGFAVDAVSQSRYYRLSRFVRRHALAVVGTVVVATVTASLAGYAIYEGYRAERALAAERNARETSEQVTRFMVGIFDKANPEKGNPADVSVRDLLDQGYEAAKQELAEQPDVLVSVLAAIGNAHYSLGLYESSVDINEDLLAAAQASAVDSNPEVGQALLNYANSVSALEYADSMEQAEPIHQEAIRYIAQLEPAEHWLLGTAYIAYANSLSFSARPAQARDLFAQAIAEFQAMEEPDYTKIAWTHQNTAVSWLNESNVSEANLSDAAAAFVQAKQVITRHRLDNLSLAATVALNLGATYLLLNDPASALAEIEPAQRTALTLYPQHPRAVYATRLLGNVAVLQGRFDEAQAHFESARSLAQELQGGARGQVLGVVTSYLAELAALRGDSAAADALYQEAYRHFGSPGDPDQALEWISNRVEFYPLERLSPPTRPE